MNSSARTVVSIAALMVVALGVVPVSAVASRSTERPDEAERKEKPIKLGVGDERFWDGEEFDRATIPSASLCRTAGRCPEYALDVKRGGRRLRVALTAVLPEADGIRPWPDFPQMAAEMIFDLEVLDPSGAVVADGSTDYVRDDSHDLIHKGDTNAFNHAPVSGYSVEVFVERPEAGIYTARVIPVSVIDMAFLMRAKLEGASPALDPQALLSPNLRMIPPFEVGFMTPTSSFGAGATIDPRASCMGEELADEAQRGNAALLCLRYSMGAENVGDGRFDLRFNHPCNPIEPEFIQECDTESASDPLSARVHQRLWRPDGTFHDEPSGSGGWSRFHATHAHNHYQNIYQLELFFAGHAWSPGSPKPALVKEGDGQKLGFEPTQEYLADWDRFYQLGRDYDAQGAAFAFQTGWGDLYEWNRGGNYVLFPPTSSGDPRPGYYLLRGTTDPDGLVIESVETDNVSFAFLHVSARGEVELLQRGYGTDPWDPSKQVLTISP